MLAMGDIEIQTILDYGEPFMPIAEVFKDATPEALAPHMDWLVPRVLFPGELRMNLPVQSYLVKTRHHTILIDTCIGCDKTSGGFPEWRLRTDQGWLNRLTQAGVQPEEIDYVFCSHLHVDHVGWNTRFVDGVWQPTFPNARYIFAKEEYEASEAINSKSFRESVLPIMDAKQADLVAMDFQLDDEVSLQPTTGHTPGHVAINLTSQGEHAAMTGDLIHSPIQCVHPDWAPFFDADPDQARKTRRAFLEQHADTGNYILTAHFPPPSMGHIRSRGDAFFFHYLNED